MMMSSLDRTSPQQLEQPCLKSEDKVVVKYLWICQKLSNKSTQSCQKGGKKIKSRSISPADFEQLVDSCVAAEEKPRRVSPRQDHLIHMFLFRRLIVSRCNLQSESCRNYTPPSLFYTTARKKKVKKVGLSVLAGSFLLRL